MRAAAAPNAFRYDVSAGHATLAPPAPFAGVGRYERSASGHGRLLGGLSVDFPGRAGVRLAGPTTRAGLQRYLDNPSHPFRPTAHRRFSPRARS